MKDLKEKIVVILCGLFIFLVGVFIGFNLFQSKEAACEESHESLKYAHSVLTCPTMNVQQTKPVSSIPSWGMPVETINPKYVYVIDQHVLLKFKTFEELKKTMPEYYKINKKLYPDLFK